MEYSVERAAEFMAALSPNLQERIDFEFSRYFTAPTIWKLIPGMVVGGLDACELQILDPETTYKKTIVVMVFSDSQITPILQSFFRDASLVIKGIKNQKFQEGIFTTLEG